MALLKEAIAFEREALSLYLDGHSARTALCINLATSLSTLFNQTGEMVLLDEATVLYRPSVQSRVTHPSGFEHFARDVTRIFRPPAVVNSCA
jgi:hypothetical protein